MQRDLRIDLVRGAGVLMIAVDHLKGLLEMASGGPVAFPFITWTRLGWSSAAEFFVFFSGYLVGLIYTQTLRRQGFGLACARAAHRSWQIYVANLLTLCAVLVLLHPAALASASLVAATKLSSLEGAGAMTGWFTFLTLQTAPAFFEILHLYIALLFVAPLLLLVARMNVLAALACSVAVWACVQFNPSFNVASWNFNPFAWQLVFILGMLCSVAQVFDRLAQAFGRRTLLLSTGAVLGAALLVKIVDKAGWPLPLIGQLDVTGIARTTVGPLLLLHFLASVVFVMQIVPRSDSIGRSQFGQLIARVGQHSLECFCASTVLVYTAVGWMMQSASTGPMWVFTIGLVILALVCWWAMFVNWIKAQPWRRAPVPRESARAAQEADQRADMGSIQKKSRAAPMAPAPDNAPVTTPDTP